MAWIIQMQNIHCNNYDKSSQGTICSFGLPEAIVNDNGSQFTGSDFKNFSKSRAIEHMTTSSCNLKSNGLAKKFIFWWLIGCLGFKVYQPL